MNFICNICNYKTDRKSSYDTHVSSIKHQQNTAIYNKYNSKYKCNVCNIGTDNITNYNKHILTKKHLNLCKSNDKQLNHSFITCGIKETHKDDLLEAKDTIIDLQKQLLNDKNKTNDFLQSQLKTKDKQIKTSNGLLKYLVKNHPNAPPLQQITNFTFIRDETECRSRMPELLIEYFNTDKFSQYLAENIVAIYKKAEPKDQSLWTSDVSRDNFIVKNKINENESAWIRDIKGNIMIEHAVRPCLNIILEELKWYFHELINGITHKGKLNPSVTTIDTMLRIKQAIDDKKIEDEIRKILSPKFCYPINAIEDVKL
jgi:hypothetical protein